MTIRKLVIAALAMMFVALLAACLGSAETPGSPASTEDPSAGVGMSETGTEMGTAAASASPTASAPMVPSSPSPTGSSTASPTTPALENVPSTPLAPVFSVATIDGETIRLEDLLGTVPVYLIFIPGTDNELDRSQMSSIQSRHGAFEKLEAKVVVVVSDLPTSVIDMRDELELEFPLISDPLHVVAADWQVFDLENEGKVSPASFVFDAHGKLIARLVATEPDDRPSVDEVLYVIEESLSVGAA
jgi:peroxiredoxin